MRSAVLVAILGFTGIAAAGAATVAFAGDPAEGSGRSFGEHMSGMAPEHAQAHGAMFGECASTMAQAGEDSHMQ